MPNPAHWQNPSVKVHAKWEIISDNIDGLEASMIWSAPFSTGFLEFIFGFYKFRNAPLPALFIDIIPYDLYRKN